MFRNISYEFFDLQEVRRARLIFIVAGALTPLWHFITKFYYPEQIDYLAPRLFISAVFLGMASIMHRLPRTTLGREKFLLPAGLLISIHALYITWINNWHTHHVVGTVVVICTTYSMLGTRRGSWLYSFLIITAAALLAIYYPIAHPVPVVLTWALTIIIAGKIASYSRLKTINDFLISAKSSTAVMRNMTEGVVVRDENLRALFVNAAALEIFGQSVAEVYGLRFSDGPLIGFDVDNNVLRDEDLPASRAFATGKTVRNFPMKIKRSGGKIVDLLVTAVPVKSEEDGKCDRIITTFRDVTESKNNEKQIAQQQALLVHSAKLTALGEMAGGIAHEINSPLTTIATNADLLGKKLNSENFDKAQVLTHVERIRKTVDRIAKIILGMRSLSKIESGSQDETISVTKLFELISDMGREHLIKNGIQLRICLADVFDLKCQSVQITQILLNLVNNAADALNEIDTPDKWIQIESKLSSNYLELSVSDNGPGVLPSHIEKLWQPFFTTKPVGKGLGIGLSISRKIAESHGGSLIYAPEGKSAKFVLLLPLDRWVKKSA